MIGETLKNEERLVKKLVSGMQSAAERLRDLYLPHFPITCSSCQKKFITLEEFIQQKPPKSVESKEGHNLVNNHDCVCGHPLFKVTYNPRNDSIFGKKLRRVFDLCVHKLMDRELLTEQKARDQVRKLIREEIDMLNYYKNEQDLGFFNLTIE